MTFRCGLSLGSRWDSRRGDSATMPGGGVDDQHHSLVSIGRVEAGEVP